jgi:hypothetical protein
MIRIDVHPAGETRLTHHIHPTLSPHMVPDHTYLTWSTHSNLSWSRQQRRTEPLLPTQSTARRLTDPRVRTQFLSQDSHWNNGDKFTLYWRQDTRLTGPISPACDRYVQYLLTGVNTSVLNWHRWGLQPPKGQAQSQVIQSQHSLRWKWCEITITDPWSFDHSVSTKVYIYA